MPSESKYQSFRILQPRIKQNNLFNIDKEDSALRSEAIRAAVTLGTQTDLNAEGGWIAGAIKEIEGGLTFKMGLTQNVRNFKPENGDFKEFEERFTKLTDVIIEFANGLMLIRRDSATPSAFLGSKVFQRWLEIENERLGTGFDSRVQAMPKLDDFIHELEESVLISSVTFVVRGPNPEDEEDIVEQIANFTEAHGLGSTTVTIHAQDIDQDTAKGVTRAAGNVGDKVSATIVDKAGAKRTIHTKKKPNELPGPKNPSPEEAVGLIARLRRIVDKIGVKKEDGGD